MLQSLQRTHFYLHGSQSTVFGVFSSTLERGRLRSCEDLSNKSAFPSALPHIRSEDSIAFTYHRVGKESFGPGMCQAAHSAQELRALLAETGLCSRTRLRISKMSKPQYLPYVLFWLVFFASLVVFMNCISSCEKAVFRPHSLRTTAALIYPKLDWYIFASQFPCQRHFMYILYQQQFLKVNDLQYVKLM